MAAVGSILVLLFLLTFIMAFLSLLFPVKFASFLPEKFRPQQLKRLTVFSRYFLISVISFLLFGWVAENDPTLKSNKQNAQVQVTENTQNGEVTITVTDNDKNLTSSEQAQTAEKSSVDSKNAKDKLAKNIVILLGILAVLLAIIGIQKGMLTKKIELMKKNAQNERDTLLQQFTINKTIKTNESIQSEKNIEKIEKPIQQKESLQTDFAQMALLNRIDLKAKEIKKEFSNFLEKGTAELTKRENNRKKLVDNILKAIYK